QSRIFQHLSVPDILKEVLRGLDVSFDLQGTFHPRDFCVQYRETDLNFASRLMEDEGIFYFFEHNAGGHRMVLANSARAHPEVPGGGGWCSRASRVASARRTASRSGTRLRRCGPASGCCGTTASSSPTSTWSPRRRSRTACRRARSSTR